MRRLYPFFIVFFIASYGVAQVGIGSLTPTSMLHVADTVLSTSSWEGSFIDIQNVSSVLNTSAGIRFKVDDVVSSQKHRAGIFFKRTTSEANGTLIFSNSDATGTGNVTSTTNARMAITHNGWVGIGTTSPDHFFSILGEEATIDGSNGVFMDIQNKATSYGVLSGIRFRNGTTNETFKGGIFYHDVEGYGRGSIIFANNDVNGGGNVTLNDARMTIKSNGNVGIGTTEPEEIFHLYEANGGLDVKFESDNGNPKLYMDGTTGSSGFFFEENNVLKASLGYNINNDYLFFTHGQTIAMKGGKLGIGTTSPQYPIHIKTIGTDCEAALETTSGRTLLRLDGVTGLSEVRFQSGGTYKAAMGYNHDDDNLFMYHNGNLKFSNGNLYVSNDYKYITDKSVTFQFPSCSFVVAHFAEEEDDILVTADGKLQIVEYESLGEVDMFAAVNLPDGAVITSISDVCYVESSYPFVDNHCHLKLYRRGITDTIASEMAEILVYDTGGDIDTFTTTSISNDTIDNSNYQYYLMLNIGDVTSEFWGARLTYTISGVSY